MSSLQVTKLTPVIGAEITGADFSRSPDAQLCDELYQLLMEHQVIFFRDQFMTPEVHVALAKSFGSLDQDHPAYPELEDHPAITVLDFGPHNPPDVDTWHADLTFREDAPFASILYSRQIPPYGGDTIWSSLTAAYDALPEDMKQELENRRAVHDLGDFRNGFTVGRPDGNARELVEAHLNFGSALHPMVKVHPATGQRILYYNPALVVQVEGESAIRSRRLLNYLYDHVIQPEFQVRFRWTENTVAMWDNRCTLHYALSDYLPHRRVMHRITVTEDQRVNS